jgi:putative FmdB family regulatory protein
MPAYDYVCLECGKEFEHTQPISSSPLERCIYNGCNGKVKRRIGNGAGIIFKGSGFYETDYKRSGASSNGGNGAKSDAPVCPAAQSGECKSGTCPAAAAKE